VTVVDVERGEGLFAQEVASKCEEKNVMFCFSHVKTGEIFLFN
jgi:hypothetical protein